MTTNLNITARELLTMAGVEISEPHDPIECPYGPKIYSKKSRLTLSMGQEKFDDFIVSFIDRDGTLLVRNLLRRLIEEKERARNFYKWYKDEETKHIDLLKELSELSSNHS